MPALTTAQILAAILGSSVFSAIVTHAVAIWREAWKAKREAAFSALYVAIALEDYAGRCSVLITDSENYDSTDGYHGSAHGNIVELPDYPTSVEWKPFGIDATNKALSFRVEIENTRAMITGLWEFDDEDGIVSLVREESARLGLKALNLATELRRRWKLQALASTGDWDVKADLEERLAHYLELREQREEQNRKMNAELLGRVDRGADPAAQTPG